MHELYCISYPYFTEYKRKVHIQQHIFDSLFKTRSHVSWEITSIVLLVKRKVKLITTKYLPHFLLVIFVDSWIEGSIFNKIKLSIWSQFSKTGNRYPKRKVHQRWTVILTFNTKSRARHTKSQKFYKTQYW